MSYIYYDISAGLILSGLLISSIVISTFSDISSSTLLPISGYIYGGSSIGTYTSYSISSIIIIKNDWLINTSYNRFLGFYFEDRIDISGNIIIRNGTIYSSYINNISTTSIFNNLYNNLYLIYSTLSGLTSSGLIYYNTISLNLLINYLSLNINNYILILIVYLVYYHLIIIV
jgi:hypothetical protein